MKLITKEYLAEHPDEIFVFGDNTHRKGCGGAAILRYEKNVYGFITKKAPTHETKDYYTPQEYAPVFVEELKKLEKEIVAHPDKRYLISKLGAGLANKFKIYEAVIMPALYDALVKYHNVEFLF